MKKISIRRRIKKTLMNIGLLKKPAIYMELTEGHLGGYILNKAAPGTWCPEIWDWSIDDLGVKSMLDVGCGLGYSAQYYRDKGIKVFGVDGSPSAITNNVLPKDSLHQHDYTKGPWKPSNRMFDLVWSSEFLEHVEQQYEENFMTTFQCASKYLMVTFAVPGQGGHHHVNLQHGQYWIDKFESNGFKYSKELTNHARSLVNPEGLIGMQFRDKGLVFIKVDKR